MHVQNVRIAGIIGVFYVKAATLLVEDSDFIHISAAITALAFGRSGGQMTFINSRVENVHATGHVTYEGSVGYIDGESSLRYVGGMIQNVSGSEKFAFVDGSYYDFAMQLDSVVVDDTVSVFSNGTIVLIQNCDGFDSTAVAKAEIGTCATTAAYCLRESCSDATAGIECVCNVSGTEVPFPTDCMQSAVIQVPLTPPHSYRFASPAASSVAGNSPRAFIMLFWQDI